MEKFDTIIIGSGIGGLALGAMLSHRKDANKVLILEKNSSIGGRLFAYERDGFKFEMGCHMSSTSGRGPIGDILRIVDKLDSVKFTYVRPMTFYAGKIFGFPRGLQGIVPDKEFNRLIEMYRQMMSLNPSEIAELDEVDFCSYVHRYTDDMLIHACIAHLCSIFSCVPYYKSSTGEFLRFLQIEARGRATGYPHGGFIRIGEAIADGFREAGGVIKTDAKVDKIIIEDGVAKGVVAAGKTYLADTIVSNADIKHTITDLVGEDLVDKEYANCINALEYSDSILVVRLALDTVVVDWKYINYIGGGDPVKYHHDLEAGRIPDKLNLFIPAISNLDPGMAPKGKQLLAVGVVTVPFEFQNLEGLKEAALETVQSMIPDIKKHIMWTDVTTPHDIDNFVGEKGAIIGIAQTPTQAGKNRPSLKTPIKNLYICGAEAGGWGEGTELAVESARSLFMLLYQ